MNNQGQSNPGTDIAVLSVSGKEDGKSNAAVNSSENVSLGQCTSDASVVAGQCASSPIVAASSAPIIPVVKTLETTSPSVSSSPTPVSSVEAPFLNVTSPVTASQNNFNKTSENVSSISLIKGDLQSSVTSVTIPSTTVLTCSANATEVKEITNTPADLATIPVPTGGEVTSSAQDATTAVGGTTVTPFVPSSAPRRSSRARRINSRFDLDEVDENIKKFVARIAAPDSHSILQSPELAFHCPAPPPPPPPASVLPKASSDQTGEQKLNAKKPQKKFVKRLHAVVEIEKCKKETIAAFSSGKSKVFKKNKQDTSKLRPKSSPGQSAIGSDSDDDLPLTYFTGANTSAGSEEKAVLTPISSKSKVLNSKSASSLPSKYSIKTIHNPDLSSTPISIVCIEDPEEEEEEDDEELTQNSKKKVRKKMSNENIPGKNRRGGPAPSFSKMNGIDGMRVPKKASTKPSSKVKNSKKLELEKLKDQLNASQGSTGKLLKIVNLKVVPSSLPDIPSSTVLRKLIEKSADHGVGEKVPAVLDRASSPVPDQACVDKPEAEAEGSSQTVMKTSQSKKENLASKYDDLKALLHADEPPLSSEWLHKESDRSGSLPIKDEHNPCNSPSNKISLNLESTLSAKQDSSVLKSVSNVSFERSDAGNENLTSDSPRVALKVETVEVSNSSKRPSTDVSVSSSKKVKHECSTEKVVSNTEKHAKESSSDDFDHEYRESDATFSSNESLDCNLTRIKVDPWERKPDLAMVRDTRVQYESSEQEKEVKLRLTSTLQDEKIQESMRQCTLSLSPGTLPLSDSARNASKSTSIRRSRTDSPSEPRSMKRIKVSPVDSKEDIKPDLLMTKIIEGTGVESKPVIQSFKPSAVCSSPVKLRDCEEDSSTSGDRSFKEEPREPSELLHTSSASSQNSFSTCEHNTSSRDNITEQMRENKNNDSHLESKDKLCNDGLNSSLNVGKHSSCDESEDSVGDDRNNQNCAYGTSASRDARYSSLDAGKSTRDDKIDGRSPLDSKIDRVSSDKKDRFRSDKKDTDRSRGYSRGDKKGSSRSERKDNSRTEKHSSSYKNSHSSRDKYHSGSSGNRSSSSSRNSGDRKTERSSHKSRHESSRSRDQKSSRKDNDSRRDYDTRDKSEKDRSRRSDDKKRDCHEKKDKIADTSEVRLSEELIEKKTPCKPKISLKAAEASKSVLSHEPQTENKQLQISSTHPMASCQDDDVDESKRHVKNQLSHAPNIAVIDETINNKIEINTPKSVGFTSQDITCASSGNDLVDVKFSVQETVNNRTLISSVATSEECQVMSSESFSGQASIEVKSETSSAKANAVKRPSICMADVSQVECITSKTLSLNSSAGSQSHDSAEEIGSTPLETVPRNISPTVDTATPINITALLDLCRANIPNSSKSQFAVKTEETESETLSLSSVVEASRSASSIANTRNLNSSGNLPEAIRSINSSAESLASNHVPKEECRVNSPTLVSVIPNSLTSEGNFEESKAKVQQRLRELGDSSVSDALLNPSLRSDQSNTSRDHLCIRLEDLEFEKKLSESSSLDSKDECNTTEECNAVDSMNVDDKVLTNISGISVDVKVSPVPSVEETPEEKEKRLEEERLVGIEKELRNKAVVEARMKSFIHLSENLYLIDRKKSKQSKEVRRMVCDCFLTKEEISRGEKGCGEDCLNRLLMIECGWRCPLGEACLNRQFQRCDYGPVEVFNAEEKGCGVRATSVISPGTFIMEYVGEVFDQREFRRRRKDYGKDGTAHFYFMALRVDQFIDATKKGNISRFVNHSCDPNAETQKWTVNGELRIGFFATKFIAVGEEINFDYRMERYGREPQKCYCGTAVCRGWLGEPPDEKTKEEKEEERKRLASSDKRKKEDKKHFDDELLDDVSELARVGLRNKRDTLLLSRVMVRAETDAVRVQLLTLLCAATANLPCLRLFMDYHGLSLLWSWMADLNTALQHAPLKLQILKTLDILPITNRTQVSDSRVLEMVEKWSKQLPPPPATSISTSTVTTSDGAGEVSVSLSSDTRKSSDGDGFEETDDSSQQSSDDNSKQGSDDNSKQGSDDNSKQGSDDNSKQGSDDNNKRSPDENSKQMLSPDDNSSDSNSSAVKSKSAGVNPNPLPEGTSNDQISEDEDAQLRKTQLEMVELALKLLERWQVLKEEFRIPKKQRVELMKEHEREVEAGYRRYLNTERGRRETRDSRYGRSSYDSRRSKMHVLDSHDKTSSWSSNDAISIMMNSEEFAGLSKEERREKFAQKVAQVDEQRRLQEGMWSVHVERCAHIGLDPYQSPIVDPSGQYYWDSSNSTWVPLTPETAYAAGMLSPAVAQQHGMTPGMGPGFCMPGVDQPVPYDPHVPPVMNGEVLPPLVVTIKLPPHWHIARDQLNRVYFYHNRSRQTQWEIPTNETKTSIQISDSESESSSSSSDSEEEFSSDEDEGNDEEVALATSPSAAEDSEAAVEGKIIRRQRGRKKHSEALVQQRVISPIRELDREQARKERREAKERAKHEARKERHFHDQQGTPSVEEMEDEVEGTPDDLLISRVVHPARDKVKTKSKERAATAIADNSERARKIKDLFRSRMATFIVSVLNPYRRADCKQGRINTTDDFKYLARKLTHFVMVKELKQLPSIEDLDCSESVKHKTKDFVRKYMAKYGTSFKRDPLDTKEY
ncbi:WW domain [Trinorchestia longiramus]|nr:WW domain [Trinorchestia longiramus]